MGLLRLTDYPPQIPRPQASMDFQARAWELSEPVEGIDIAWGDDVYQRIALYPAENPNGTVFAFIHGGRWTSGYKETMGFVAPTFTKAGITFASLGHRLAPNHYAEGFHDVSNGIACLAKVAGEHGGDASKIFVGGHSSGGHYAAQLALTGDWQSGLGLPGDAIKGCLPVSGVYDVSQEGGMGDWPPPCLKEGQDGRAESPIHRIDGTPPPFLVGWGSDDYPFLIPQAKALAEALKAAGGDVETIELAGKTHFSVLIDGADEGGEWSEKALGWLKAHAG